MAEFVEVCRQALRMAEAEAQRKGNGRTYVEFCISKDGGIVCWASTATAEEIERTVMEWAIEHPEPEYPSWKEAWQRLFPGTPAGKPPCVRYFVNTDRFNAHCEKYIDCKECHDSPIPVDIAEKLGVKAIERSGNK